MKTPARLLILIATLYSPLSLAHDAADPGCKRIPLNPESPAGLKGRYEIVGKDPLTGSSYTGTLVVDYGKNGYSLTRTVGGNVTHGQAWLENCGVDKTMTLSIRYSAKPAIEGACFLKTDGDNYYRMTCRTGQADSEWHGLEAWFQQS